MRPRNLATTITGAQLVAPILTGSAPAIPQRNTVYTDSIIKGWVETSGAGVWTIDDDFNVSSITDNAVGDFTVNWTTAFASANYVVVGTHASGSTTSLLFQEVTTTAKTASLVRIALFIGNSGVNQGDPGTGISVIAIGNQ
ncbi:MAG: hypothetical protein ACRD5H_01080 [Nitrososphaerales archaeon]